MACSRANFTVYILLFIRQQEIAIDRCRCEFLRNVRRFETDVSGILIGSVFKGQGPVGSSKTSVSNHRTPRNNQEYERISVKKIQVLLKSDKTNGYFT
jgi:hypothetical protein